MLLDINDSVLSLFSLFFHNFEADANVSFEPKTLLRCSQVNVRCIASRVEKL